jgi:hypothetical protein
MSTETKTDEAIREACEYTINRHRRLGEHPEIHKAMAWDICEACAMARAILAALDEPTRIMADGPTAVEIFRREQIKAIARALGLQEDE